MNKQPPANVSVVECSRGVFAATCKDVGDFKPTAEGDTAYLASLALGAELIRLGSDIIEHHLGIPRDDVESMMDSLTRLADRKAAAEIDAGACRTQQDFRRAREAGDELEAARDGGARDQNRSAARMATSGKARGCRVPSAETSVWVW